MKDAETSIAFCEAGEYQVFARTKDWVSPWKAGGAPGKFRVLVNGTALSETFGTTGDCHWQKGGMVRIAQAGEVKLALHDLTGLVHPPAHPCDL